MGHNRRPRRPRRGSCGSTRIDWIGRIIKRISSRDLRCRVIGSRDLIVVDTVVDAASIHGLGLADRLSQWGIYVRVNEILFSYFPFGLTKMWMTKGKGGHVHTCLT